jgi:hypothetical protein
MDMSACIRASKSIADSKEKLEQLTEGIDQITVIEILEYGDLHIKFS